MVTVMWDWRAGVMSGTTDVLGSAIRRVEEAMLAAPDLMSGAVWRVRFRPGHDERVDRGREGLGMHPPVPRPADLAPRTPVARHLTVPAEPISESSDERPCGCHYDPLVFGHDWRRHDNSNLADRLDLLRRERLAGEG